MHVGDETEKTLISFPVVQNLRSRFIFWNENEPTLFLEIFTECSSYGAEKLEKFPRNDFEYLYTFRK